MREYLRRSKFADSELQSVTGMHGGKDAQTWLNSFSAVEALARHIHPRCQEESTSFI